MSISSSKEEDLEVKKGKNLSPSSSSRSWLAEAEAMDWSDLAVSLERDDMIAKALDREISLKDYSKQVDGELRQVEVESVRDYLDQSERVASLNAQMKNCDEALISVQKVLASFDKRLKGTAKQVRNLQSESILLEIKLNNRVAVEKRLSGYLRRLILPSDTEMAIESLSPLEDERFAAYVALIDSRLDEFGRDAGLSNSASITKHRGLAMSPAECAAGEDCLRRLEQLKTKASFRIREALLNAIYQLRASSSLFITVTPAQKLLSSTQAMLKQKKSSTTNNKVTVSPPPSSPKSSSSAGEDYFSEAQDAAMSKSALGVKILRQDSLATVGGALFRFVEKRTPLIATELRAAYVDAASKAFYTVFKAYADAIVKAELPVANRHDLVAVDETAVRNAVTSRVSLAKRGDAFALSDRDSVLKIDEIAQLEATECSAVGIGKRPSFLTGRGSTNPSHKDTAPKKYPIEVLFKSLLRRVRDLATCEAYVIGRCFEEADGPDIFDAVFQRLVQAFLDILESKIQSTHDLIGLMLIAKLIDIARAQDNDIIVNRNCASPQSASRLGQFLATSYDALENCVWPKLHSLAMLNVDSAKNAKPATVAAVSPHHVSRRFAELAAAVLALFPPPAPEPSHTNQRSRIGSSSLLEADLIQQDRSSISPPLSPSGKRARAKALATLHRERESQLRDALITNLRDEVLGLLARMATDAFPEQMRDRVVFLANNYDMILVVLKRRKIDAHAVATLTTFFEGLLARQRDAYVDTTLDQNFGQLVAFVKTTEQDLNTSKKINLDAEHVEFLVHHFAKNWEPFLQKVNDEIFAYFANFLNGTEVLKLTFTQLLLYYTRFQDIVRKAWRRPPPFAKDLVSAATVLLEIKKYTRTFS
mmetsp:Transcript_8626/g.13266  ORF Transcript_8626/g.13266 Transcript_8626/m.13266 type:complete len:877 (+) Transcript_8626:29-2659(+)